MHTVILKLIVATCVIAIVAQAQTRFLQQDHSANKQQVSRPNNDQNLATKAGENDFLFPGQGFVGRKTTTKSGVQNSLTSNIVSSGFPVESIVQYQSFSLGTIFTLHAFSGKYVSYLLPESQIGVNGLSRDEIRELVDLTDLLYAHMMEIVGGEPSGEGPLTLALLDPGYDFGGKGWIGRKGVEIFPTYLVDNKNTISAGCIPNIVIHEMSHNFDLYNAYISHDGDNAHAWTAFLIPYAEYYSRTGVYWNGLVIGPDELLDHTITNYLDPWDAAGDLTWDNCVKNGSGCWDQEIYANETWAGIVLRFAQLHGTSTMRHVFSFLKDYKASHPTPPASAEAKNDVLVLAFASATQSNIQCELGVWRWPASIEMIEEMERRFPGLNSFCNDLDGDGYTPTQNDHDDFNAMVNPAAREAVNGIDDDCDGIVDNLVINEDLDFSDSASNASLLPVPSHIIGRMSSTDDRDTFRLEISSPRSLNIWTQGMGLAFSGWLELRYASDPDSSAPIYVWPDYPGGSMVAFDRPGTWILTVVASSDDSPGYETFLSEIQSAPFPQLRVMPISKSSFIIANITSDQNGLKQSLPTDVRIWAEGVGFIAQQPFQPVTVFKLRRYGMNVNARLRAQFLTNNSPTSSVTIAVANKSYQPMKVISAPVAVSSNANAAPNPARRLNKKAALLDQF